MVIEGLHYNPKCSCKNCERIKNNQVEIKNIDPIDQFKQEVIAEIEKADLGWSDQSREYIIYKINELNIEGNYTWSCYCHGHPCKCKPTVKECDCGDICVCGKRTAKLDKSEKIEEIIRGAKEAMRDSNYSPEYLESWLRDKLKEII